MGLDTRVRAIATAIGDGRKRRIVGAGGAGKTQLLDLLVAELQTPVRRWSAAVDPDHVPPDDGVALVDDAQLAAPAALQALARRAGGVVAAHRPARREVAAALETLDSSPVVLGPLSPAELHALLAASWDREPEPAVVAAVHRATAGLPRLVTAVTDHRPIIDVRRTAMLDELVRSERERLRPGARRLLDAAAILGPLELSVLAAASGLPIGDATAAAAHLATVGLAVDPAATLPPIVADAVRHLAAASDVTAIAERAATAALAAGGDLSETADRLRDIGVDGPATARCLLAAARQVHDTDPERAARWLAAVGRRGTATPDHAALRALIGFRRDRPDETVRAVDDLLRAGAELADCELRRSAVEAAAVVLARTGAWARSGDLADLVGDGGEIAPAVAAIARLAVGDVAGVRASTGEAADTARAGLRSAVASAVARGLAATADAEPGRALPLLLEAARMHELSPPAIALPESPAALAAVVACHLWEFDVAVQILSDDPPDRPTVRGGLVLGWAALRRDDLAGAEAAVSRARAAAALAARDDLVACAIEAGVARHRGDLDGMERAWVAARPLLLRQVPDLLLCQPIGELLIVGARLGERATVDRCLAAVRELVAATGDAPLWALSLRWDELHIAVASNDAAAARRAAVAAQALPGGIGRAAVVVRAATSWAALLDGRIDAERVTAVAHDLAAVGLGRDAARLAGATAIRVTDAATMRELLQLARELHGERPSVSTQVATDELTPREQDVARHLLAGLTYREIGRQLYLAPKTIEHHVARIRRKLGAGSRAELLAALRRQPSPVRA